MLSYFANIHNNKMSPYKMWSIVLYACTYIYWVVVYFNLFSWMKTMKLKKRNYQAVRAIPKSYRKTMETKRENRYPKIHIDSLYLLARYMHFNKTMRTTNEYSHNQKTPHSPVLYRSTKHYYFLRCYSNDRNGNEDERQRQLLISLL